MPQPRNASSRPSKSLTTHHSWSLLVSIIFIVVFCAVAWFASPKGENQTYVIDTYPPSHGLHLLRGPNESHEARDAAASEQDATPKHTLR